MTDSHTTQCFKPVPFLCIPPIEKIPLPDGLKEISTPPEFLYAQGNVALLEQLPQLGIGIVGTRNPQLRSIVFCEQMIEALERSGLIVISGLARGIDAVAHRKAIESHLPTVAVLGAGLDSSYPEENRALRAAILKNGGLLISEYPIGVPPRGFQFLHRNRIIAGLSKATWVVEAALRSGALNTAKWARELDRTCFAVPCFPGDPYLAGNQMLIDRDHAFPLYGPHNLGAAWLELASLKNPPQSELPSLSSKVGLLVTEVMHQKYTQGGISMPDLRAWAHSRHWTPNELYETLARALEQGRITQWNTTLVTK